LRDWPDTYIHTDHDSLEQMDATKLRRVAALGAAAGYVFASLDAQQLPLLLPFFTAQSEARLTASFEKAQRWVMDPGMAADVAWYEANNLLARSLQRESEALHSLVVYTGGAGNSETEGDRALTAQTTAFNLWLERNAKSRGAKAPASPWANNASTTRVAVRIAPFGPVQNQNDDALLARLGRERYNQIMLLNGGSGHYVSVLDQRGLYAYEILNFVNGKRTVGQIRDAVSAEYRPIPVELVADYLEALAEAKIVSLN
jgi:hypothetical protein